MSKNRVSGYVDTWAKEVRIEVPTPPTEEEVNSAMREIADYPTTFGIIEDLVNALSIINRIPEKTEAHIQILDRYMPLVHKIELAAKALLERMRDDFERASQKPEDNSGTSE